MLCSDFILFFLKFCLSVEHFGSAELMLMYSFTWCSRKFFVPLSVYKDKSAEFNNTHWYLCPLQWWGCIIQWSLRLQSFCLEMLSWWFIHELAILTASIIICSVLWASLISLGMWFSGVSKCLLAKMCIPFLALDNVYFIDYLFFLTLFSSPPSQYHVY